MNTFKVRWRISLKKIDSVLIECSFYFLDDCHEEVRLMHLKLLLQQGPNHSTDDSIGKQFAWNQAITDDHIVLKSFLQSIVGGDFRTRRATFEAILEKCDDWLQQSWKCLLLLLRMVVDIDSYQKFNVDERNAFKAKARSEFSTSYCERCCSTKIS